MSASTRRAAMVALAVVLGGLFAGDAALAGSALELLPPHAARRSGASLSPELTSRIRQAADDGAPTTTEEAIAVALRVTGEALRFGLDHPTRLRFTATEREASCIEYSHLFAAVFDRVAERRGLPARAYAVHSARARLLGLRLPMRGFADHDWALVVEPAGGRWHIDATLHDAGLGWDIRAAVRGKVSVPGR